MPEGIAPHFASQPKIFQDQKKLVIDIEIKAQPTPSVSWFLNDKDLSESTNGHFVVKTTRKANDLYQVQLEINVRLIALQELIIVFDLIYIFFLL